MPDARANWRVPHPRSSACRNALEKNRQHRSLSEVVGASGSGAVHVRATPPKKRKAHTPTSTEGTVRDQPQPQRLKTSSEDDAHVHEHHEMRRHHNKEKDALIPDVNASGKRFFPLARVQHVVHTRRDARLVLLDSTTHERRMFEEHDPKVHLSHDQIELDSQKKRNPAQRKLFQKFFELQS